MVSSSNGLSSSAVNGSAVQKNDERVSVLVGWTNNQLLQIIRRHFNTQYAVQAPCLSGFRNAVAAHGGIDVDTTLLADFRTHVPLSNYDCYKPFLDRFDRQPCRQEDVENLLVPGLPSFLATSSSTSGKPPKLVARYPNPKRGPLYSPFFKPNSKIPLAAVVYCGSMGVREVVDESGQVVKKLPVCLGSGQRVRKFYGWEFDDDVNRMSMAFPYYAVPWAATIIAHYPSFLTIHGLFFLTHRDIHRLYMPFATSFIDLIGYIEKRWDALVYSIKNGTLPELEGIDHVRDHLQAHLHADPERATELLEIGTPFSVEGWVSRVWPDVRELCTVCTGPWGMMLPKVRSILGPDILISSPGYGASEAVVSLRHDMDKPDEFILPNDNLIEFLDLSRGESVDNIRQAWEVEVGKQYEVIITTIHGLWRYQLGDIVTIIGFHPERHSPIFKVFGRKSMRIHLPHTEIADFYLLKAIKASNSEDTIIVQEFTTAVDNRTSPPTVGYFVELMKPPGPNARLAPEKLFDALVATDAGHQHALKDGLIRLPTIRVLRPGTFAEYRVWRARKLNISSGQFKIPTVLGGPNLQEWILERVIQEL